MSDKHTVKISFTGDLMCLKEQNEAIQKNNLGQRGYDEIFTYIKPLFSDTDFLIGNLETPISKSELSSEAICFNTPVEFVRSLVDCGFNFVSTANNHCLDRGIEGLDETIENLDCELLSHSGTYSKISNSEKKLHY